MLDSAAAVDAEHVDDPVQVLDRGELDGELALALSQGDVDPGVEAVGEPGRQVVELRVAVAGPGTTRLGDLVGSTDGDQLLDVADAEPLGDDPLGDPLHRGPVRQSEQGTGVAG